MYSQDGLPEFKCAVCDDDFANEADLHRHVLGEHPALAALIGKALAQPRTSRSGATPAPSGASKPAAVTDRKVPASVEDLTNDEDDDNLGGPGLSLDAAGTLFEQAAGLTPSARFAGNTKSARNR